MDPGPPNSQRRDVGLPQVAPPDLAAQMDRLEKARAHSRALMRQIEEGRPRRERLRESAYARLRAKMDTMPVIEQAKGVLMAQQRCGPDEAFDLLRRASQRANVKVSILAKQIVEQVAAGDAEDRGERRRRNGPQKVNDRSAASARGATAARVRR